MNFLVIGSGAREHIIAQKLFDAGVSVFSVITNRNPGLINLSKEELRALSEVSLHSSNLEMSEEAVEFWTNLYLKLRNISNACTCKEDSNAK